MASLDVVLLTCALTSAAGIVAAVLTVRHPRARFAGPRTLSFAVGVLLGVVLLDLLPGLWEATGSAATAIGLFLAALAASRLFDRVCSCEHAPSSAIAGAPSVPFEAPRTKALLLAGDGAHSVVDGLLIAAALGLGLLPGAVAALAVSLHEVPRRIAIVVLLLQAGCRPSHALAWAVGAALCTTFGGLLGGWLGDHGRVLLPFALAVTAAALLCVALGQSARLLASWRARRLARECGLPFIAGMTLIGFAHRLVESFV